MADGVKGSSQVKKEEDGRMEVAWVSREEEFIGDPKIGCFSAITWTGVRLKRFEQIIGGEMGDKLGGNSVFQYFREKEEVGYEPEVVQVIRD